MSVKIMVSYTEDKEIEGILKILKPVTKRFKIARNKRGQFYNAYIDVKEPKTLVNSGV